MGPVEQAWPSANDRAALPIHFFFFIAVPTIDTSYRSALIPVLTGIVAFVRVVPVVGTVVTFVIFLTGLGVEDDLGIAHLISGRRSFVFSLDQMVVLLVAGYH